MKPLLIAVAAAMIAALAGPGWAQVPAARQSQWPAAAYPDPNYYRYVSPTPEDAYRDHLINRWQLEQLTGPTPQALQGPSPNGNSDFGR